MKPDTYCNLLFGEKAQYFLSSTVFGNKHKGGKFNRLLELASDPQKVNKNLKRISQHTGGVFQR